MSQQEWLTEICPVQGVQLLNRRIFKSPREDAGAVNQYVERGEFLPDAVRQAFDGGVDIQIGLVDRTAREVLRAILATSFKRSESRPTRQTELPVEAIAVAIALPIPELAPVITAFKSLVMLDLSRRLRKAPAGIGKLHP